MSDHFNYLLLREVEASNDQLQNVLDRWIDVYHSDSEKNNYSFYKSHDNHNHLLEIYGFNTLNKLESQLNGSKRVEYEEKTRSLLNSDWRVQLIQLKDVVTAGKDRLPATPYIQLRHIEVPLRLYDHYMQWRKDTLLKYMRNAPEIEYFTAYHTLISNSPGVNFLCGFTCDVEKYLSVFKTSKFQLMSSEAKNNFISGGHLGLRCTLFDKIGL